MKYVESISDFFKSPKWVMNLLFAGICILIPIVGPIVLMGWLITGFWMRNDERPETFPDFDFGKFGQYLQLGLWPFLTTFVASMGVFFVFFIIGLIPSFILGMMADRDGGFIGILIGLIWLVVYAAIFLVITLIAHPIAIGGTLKQDFMGAFDLAFIKRFVSLMWKETIIGALFMLVASTVLSIVGMLALCIGIYFAMGLVYYAWAHLSKQMYGLYLSRGGAPIPVSPKLTDGSIIA